MLRSIRIILNVFAISLFSSMAVVPCTTAVISGKATRDGRPLLLKHRDSDSLNNRLMYFNDGKYPFIGLVNSGDKLGEEVWVGYNTAGFAIMNSADYNLNNNDTSKLRDREGFIMKLALQKCATLEDFEVLLRNLPKPMGAEANFGVIDATGGAAYYETSNYSFKKFDVNDPAVAPFGYLIRTNFAFSGDRVNDYGLIRYQTADDLMYIASAAKDLSPRFLMQKISRCLTHSLTKVDLSANLPQNNETPSFSTLRDFIPRYISAASVVVQGVRKGEATANGTIWTVLGFPLCSVVMPVWLAGGSELPSLLKSDESGNAPLCSMALALKKKCFPITRESGRDYINVAAILNRENTGIMQKLRPVEDSIFAASERNLDLWRKNGFDQKAVRDFYHWLDGTVRETYKREFGIVN